MGEFEEACANCSNKCDGKNQILCYLEDKFLLADEYDLRRRLVRAIYAYEASLKEDIFKDEFMSRERRVGRDKKYYLGCVSEGADE